MTVKLQGQRLLRDQLAGGLVPADGADAHLVFLGVAVRAVLGAGVVLFRLFVEDGFGAFEELGLVRRGSKGKEKLLSISPEAAEDPARIPDQARRLRSLFNS